VWSCLVHGLHINSEVLSRPSTLRLLFQAIEACLENQSQGDVEELESRDYESMANPSLLRFLVDMRGEDTSNVQVSEEERKTNDRG